jgi:hypothetical protein
LVPLYHINRATLTHIPSFRFFSPRNYHKTQKEEAKRKTAIKRDHNRKTKKKEKEKERKAS